MPLHLYRLLGKLPVPVEDVNEWGEWFATADRLVGVDLIEGWVVSTVFLGIDYNFLNPGNPHLFETMVFDREGHEQACERCSTWEQAQHLHQAVLAETRSRIRQP